MQDQTLPQTRLTFDEFDIPDARLDTPATTEQITELVTDELTSAGYDPDTITLEFTDGGRALAIFDGSNDFRTKLGTVTITAPEAKPDYWLGLADDLRQAADLFATLAGTPAPVKTALDITGAWPGNTDRSASALTDTVAAALGVSAFSHVFPAGDSVYKAGRKFAQLHAHISAYMPPEQSELERLRAENARLQAALAEGGTR